MKQLEYVVHSFLALQLVACGNVMGSETESSPAAKTATPASTVTAGRDGSGAANSAAAGAQAGTAAAVPPSSRPAMGAAGGTAGAGPSPAAGAAAPTQVAAGASAAGAGGAALAAGASAADPNTCDRACLLDFMKSYQDAMVAKDVSKLKVASNVKYSENGAVAMFGQTEVWKSVMSIVPDTLLNFADTTVGNVASQFVYNDSAQKIYQVRLMVANREITEIETMIVKQGDQFFNPEGMKVEPVFQQQIDPAKRMTREQLESITQLYLDYLEGKKSGPMVPFAETCKRYENGTVTAGGLSSFNGQSWSFDLTRRILVIDEESGITWGMFPFGQSASTLVVGEAFKIIEGKIMMIQAVMTYMPPHGVWD